MTTASRLLMAELECLDQPNVHKAFQEAAIIQISWRETKDKHQLSRPIKHNNNWRLNAKTSLEPFSSTASS